MPNQQCQSTEGTYHTSSYFFGTVYNSYATQPIEELISVTLEESLYSE